MIRQLGPPTFFLTFSAAEPQWRELIECLAKLHGVEQGKVLDVEFERELLRSDPVTCTRYYVHRFHSLKKLLQNESSILGKVIDYFFVTEFQSRGGQHDHGLFWIKDAPSFESDSSIQVAEFIDQYISTDRDLLHEEIQEVQTHWHRSTYYKRGKECRFHFPRPPMPKTMILAPLLDHEVNNNYLASFKNKK